MKRLQSVENDTVQLEVIQCDCGFHMGIDASYLDQVEDVIITCPVCDSVIDTALICPEDETKELPEGLFRESIPRILQYFEETQGLNEATRLLLLIAFIDNLTDDDSFPPIKSALIKYLQNRT